MSLRNAIMWVLGLQQSWREDLIRKAFLYVTRYTMWIIIKRKKHIYTCHFEKSRKKDSTSRSIFRGLIITISFCYVFASNIVSGIQLWRYIFCTSLNICNCPFSTFIPLTKTKEYTRYTYSLTVHNTRRVYYNTRS